MTLAIILPIIICLKFKHGNAYKSNFGHYKINADRFTEDLSVIKIIQDLTPIDCLQQCTRTKDCKNTAYERYDQELLGECILLKKHTFNDEIFIFEDHNAGELQGYSSMNANSFFSCKEAHKDGIHTDGNVFLEGLGWHYCQMTSLPKCGSGGWTLAITADGDKETFHYDSKFWTNNELYQVKKALTAPFTFEAKYKAFNQLPFKEICLGIKLKSTNVTNYIRIDLQQQHQSLLTLFQGDHKSIEDYVDSREWLSLIPKVSNQIQLCKQGFNTEIPNINSVRLGILGNEDSCTSNWVDLWIGIGGQPLYCTQKYSYITTVSHCCMVECKDRGDKAMAYVFIK